MKNDDIETVLRGLAEDQKEPREAMARIESELSVLEEFADKVRSAAQTLNARKGS